MLDKTEHHPLSRGSTQGICTDFRQTQSYSLSNYLVREEDNNCVFKQTNPLVSVNFAVHLLTYGLRNFLPTIRCLSGPVLFCSSADCCSWEQCCFRSRDPEMTFHHWLGQFTDVPFPSNVPFPEALLLTDISVWQSSGSEGKSRLSNGWKQIMGILLQTQLSF